MAAGVTREEFQVLEHEVEGEKLVTRHILEQTRRNGDDLAAVKTRLDRVEEKVDGVDRKVDQVGRKIDELAKSLSGMVADVVRQVWRERGRKR
jgi:uncharacterized protein YoxC